MSGKSSFSLLSNSLYTVSSWLQLRNVFSNLISILLMFLRIHTSEMELHGNLTASVVVCCSFFTDFGPLNIASLYRYCCKLNKKLKVYLFLLYWWLIRVDIDYIADADGCYITVPLCLGTNLIHGKNARFHSRVFKMCQISQKIHGRSLRNSRKIQGPTAVISRCYVNAN